MALSLSRNQLIGVLGVPLVVLLPGWLAVHYLGVVGLVVPMALATMLLAYLLLELRNYHLRLFTRRHTDTAALYAQIEAIVGVNAVLQPVLPLPATRGWAASPDLLRAIVTQVLTEPSDLVVEASSGTSTLVIGYCLKRLGKGRVISFEHDAYYAERTRTAVRDHGLLEYVTVIHAPLVEQEVEGKRMLWYDMSQVEALGPINMLVVDGPPDTTQHLARFPAVPLLRSKLAKGARILLDDGGRADERVIAQRWADMLPGACLEYLDFEAGAWSIRLLDQPRSA